MQIDSLRVVAAGCLLLCSLASGAPYTSGNLLIYRIGDGSAALTAAATPVFLDEYTPAGALVQSVAVPTTVSGTQLSLLAAGTSTSEGMISRSADGACVLLTGYNSFAGTVNVSSNSSAVTPRVIGVAYANGSIDTSTSVANFTAVSIRTAASTDCNELWAAGGNDGVRYVTKGAVGATAIQMSSALLNIRQVSLFGGQLYAAAATGAFRINTVGTGTPTTSGQTITNLPGLPTTGSPFSFFFADLSGGVAGVDTLYIADDTVGTGGLLKYSLVGGSWVANGSIAGSLRGLTATVSGTSVTLYATTATSGTPNALVKVTDSSGYNGNLNPLATLSSIATAGTNQRFAGVEMVPVTACSPGSFSATGNQPCTLAQAGFYVPTFGALTQIACLPGNFQANTGSTSCVPAQAGNFVAGVAAITQTPCALGNYQPAPGQSACLPAQAGYYVPVIGAIAQTPCPLGTTSGAGARACDGLPLLNVDNSDSATTYDTATDGVLLLRYLFGLRGTALIANARGAGPTLRNAAQIETHIATYLTLFDVDGDGHTLPMTDGLMILRRLLNPGALTTNAAAMAAITAGAKNNAAKTDVEVVNAIDALRP